MMGGDRMKDRVLTEKDITPSNKYEGRGGAVHDVDNAKPTSKILNVMIDGKKVKP
jgi:hypothetical protein